MFRKANSLSTDVILFSVSIVILTVHCSKLDSWMLFTNANPSKLGSTAPTLDIPTVNIAFIVLMILV